MSPRRETSHPYLDTPTPVAIAHRGGAAAGLENTLAAFQVAHAMGFRSFETDTHLTADGVVVAFHDDDLERTCGVAGRISELTWSEVAAARVDGREPIPRLADLLEEFPDVRWNIDPKSDAVLEPLGDLLGGTGVLDRVCVGSFSDRRLRRIRDRFGSALCTSMGPAELTRFRLTGRAGPGVDAVQAPVSWFGVPVVTERFVARAHRQGLHVHVWTIDDPVEMRRLLDLGVDGIMTDRPEVLKSVLEDRGDWR